MTMIVVLAAIIWMTHLVGKRLCAQPATIHGTVHSPRGWLAPPGGQQPGPDAQDGPTWSALDDHQLTRLLISSAPRTTTE